MAKILFVVANTTLNGSDQKIFDRLGTTLGHTVEKHSGDYASAPNGPFDAVVVSESISSGLITSYVNLTIPVMCGELAAWDDLGLTSTGSGSTSSASSLNVIAGTALSAGKSGNVTAATSSTTWGRPSSGATIAGTVAVRVGTDSSLAVVFYADAGTQFAGRTTTMAGKRVAFGFTAAGTMLAHENMWQIFDAAIAWMVPAGPPMENHKFYLTNRPSAYVPGVRTSNWEAVLPEALTQPLRLQDTPAGASASRTGTEVVATADYDAMLAQFISAPASADGEISGPYEVIIGREASDTNSAVFYAVIWITQGNTNQLRTGVALTGSSTWPTDPSGYRLTGDVPEMAFLTGDRLIFEVGYRATNTTTAERSGTVYFGGTSSTDLGVGDTDLNRPGSLTLAITEGVEFTEAEPLDPPGSVFDLSNWKWQGPTEDPNDPGNIIEKVGSELATYADANLFLTPQDEMAMIAPVQGVTTSGSGGTRSELREMENGTEASWSINDPGVRQLTVTMRPDPTGSTDRKEMIVMQIHAGSNPSVYLAAEYHVATPRIRVFKDRNDGTNGSIGVANIVSGITPADEITCRIRVDNGTVTIYAALGGPENLGAPALTYTAADFGDDDGWYYKVGAYNKSEVQNGGTGDVRNYISFIELIQPDAPAFDTTRFFLTY